MDVWHWVSWAQFQCLTQRVGKWNLCAPSFGENIFRQISEEVLLLTGTTLFIIEWEWDLFIHPSSDLCFHLGATTENKRPVQEAGKGQRNCKKLWVTFILLIPSLPALPFKPKGDLPAGFAGLSDFCGKTKSSRISGTTDGFPGTVQGWLVGVWMSHFVSAAAAAWRFHFWELAQESQICSGCCVPREQNLVIQMCCWALCYRGSLVVDGRFVVLLRL